jgi:hypothetical protein
MATAHTLAKAEMEEEALLLLLNHMEVLLVELGPQILAEEVVMEVEALPLAAMEVQG